MRRMLHATPLDTAHNPANGKTRPHQWLNQKGQRFVKYIIPLILDVIFLSPFSLPLTRSSVWSGILAPAPTPRRGYAERGSFGVRPAGLRAGLFFS